METGKQRTNEEKKEYLWRYSEAKKDLEREELSYKEAVSSF